MIEDPSPSLRKEINDALDVINPQIRGLVDFSKIVPPGNVADAVAAQIRVRQRRAQLLVAVTAALDNVIIARKELGADGYPNIPNVEVSDDVLKALHFEADAIAYALKIFEAKLLASMMEIRLGPVSDKP